MARGEPWALPSAADGRRKDVPPWTAGISFRMHVRCLPTPLSEDPTVEFAHVYSRLRFH